jgi:glycerate-2-kinase
MLPAIVTVSELDIGISISTAVTSKLLNRFAEIPRVNFIELVLSRIDGRIIASRPLITIMRA